MAFSSDNKQIIVNYHYVENFRKDRSKFFSCSVEKFEQQIKSLSQNYKISDIPEVFRAARENSSEKLCAITFDDGLKDQYENALPILKKYNATAVFFPITSTFTENKLPTTQKIHILLSKIPAEKLVDMANEFSGEIKISKTERLSLKRKLRDDIPTANFKETIAQLPNEKEKELMNYLFKNLGLDEKKLSQQFFMNEREIKDLAENGFSIGSHGHSHYALDFQPKESVKNEVITSKKILENITGKPLEVFSYPHSGWNQDILEILKEAGFKYAVTIEQSFVRPNDNPYLLPRFDTKDID